MYFGPQVPVIATYSKVAVRITMKRFHYSITYSRHDLK